MGRDEMRAADADRQAVADQLKASLDEGRLDLHEYDERLQQAYAAKTYGDLRPLLSDLPATALPVPARPGVVAASGTDDAGLTRRWLLEVWAGWLPVVGITTGIWLVASVSARDPLYFWPGWVAGPWGIVLLFVTVAGLLSGEPHKQAAKRTRKEQAKQLKRDRRALAAEAAARGEDLGETPGQDRNRG